MQLTSSDLKQAVEQGLLSATQADGLWAWLKIRHRDEPRFSFTHILYYLGGLLAIGAMSLFMTLGWERFGGWGIFAIALGYAAIGLWLTRDFLYRRSLPIPAGITAAFVVVLTPLAVYGLQVAMGWWDGEHVFREYHTHIDWSWLFLELATLAVAVVMLWRYRLPFSVMPLAVTLWYMSMDLSPFLFGLWGQPVDREQWLSLWELRKWVSLWFGLVVILIAFWVDLHARHHRRDYAFWLYLFGVLAFWGALSSTDSDSELSKFIYLCINLLMIGVGSLLLRRVLVVFGGLGVAMYLGHLAHEVFADSWLFPFALTVIGLGVIWLGTLWQRHEAGLADRLRAHLPMAVQDLIAGRS